MRRKVAAAGRLTREGACSDDYDRTRSYRGLGSTRWVARMASEVIVASVPVFISFDYDNDLDCKNLLVGQARNPDSPFEIADWSVKTASPDWKADARKRIKRVEQVIVVCGQHTDSATGVNVEIQIAREEKKPYFLLNGRPNSFYKKPTAALSTDKVYKWSWENLKALIAGAR